MEILNDRKYSPKHTWAKLVILLRNINIENNVKNFIFMFRV